MKRRGLLHAGLFWCATTLFAQEHFADNFERDLSGWQLIGGHAIRLVDSNDPAHGKVLAIATGVGIC